MALRVAVVAGNYTAVADGVGLTTQRQVAYLHARGDAVRVYAPAGPPSIRAPDVPAVPVPALRLRGFPYPVGWKLPAADLARFRPDVLHVTTPDFVGWWAVRWARRRRVPVAATFHTHFPAYLAAYHSAWIEPLVWRVLRAYYAHAQKVFVGCATLAEELARRGIRPLPEVLTPGVDLAHFGPQYRSGEWRLARGLARDDVVVAYVGRLAPEKSLDVFAAACHRLCSAGIRHRVLIVGEGPEAAALRHALPAAVFTGKLGGTELATAFASADVLLFPSATETFGCVTVEALASGLAVVVADAPGSRDIVRHGADGLLCPPGDPGAFAAAVTMLVRDRAERQRLREAGPVRAAAFAWPRVLADFRAALADLATTARGTCRSG
jgi:phosphatidylinositol alpha 1,6-mannosyltransferase